MPAATTADEIYSRSVTQEYIADIQRAFRITIDAEREAILNERRTRDVRACPGSGKTTLLVAKMALLSKRWTDQHRGICVLTHTNVARDEITKRLVDFKSLSILNSYPHFVGTIQSFVDQFLAIPAAIREFGVRPSRVDNEYCQYELLKEFYTSAYRTALNSLRNMFRSDASKVNDYLKQKLVFADEDLNLPPQGLKNREWGASTPSFQQLKNLKTALSLRGIFTYEDMIFLGSRYAHQLPCIKSSIAFRFPIVFIDEMQDTSPRRANLLEYVFSECVVQRFGDDRQAIYSDESEDIAARPFPASGYLTMSKSFRLSPAVCHLTTNVVCTEPEKFTGNQDRRDGRHTVFAFTASSISRVLPAFAALVATDVGIGLPSSDVRAVGANDNRQPDRLPSSIGDYMPEFNKMRSVRSKSLQTLHAYLKLAKFNAMILRRVDEARKVLIEGVVRLLREQNFTNPSIDFRSRYFVRSLAVVDSAKSQLFEERLAQIVLELFSWDATTPEIASGLVDCVSSTVGATWNANAANFIQAIDQSIASEPAQAVSDDNVFRWEGPEGIVEVLVDTIHSVKGETLKAILLLETFFHKHDLKTLIEKGYLVGRRPSSRPRAQLSEYLKKSFVAMTRPTTLLCLAICRDHLTENDIDGLKSMGWAYQEV